MFHLNDALNSNRWSIKSCLRLVNDKEHRYQIIFVDDKGGMLCLYPREETVPENVKQIAVPSSKVFSDRVTGVEAKRCFNKACTMDESQYEEAIDAYSKAIQLEDSEFSYALWNRGNLYMSHEKWEEAINDFSAIIDLHAKYLNVDVSEDEAFFNRGMALLKQQKFEEALSDFSHTIELNPNRFFSYYYRGTTLLEPFQRYEEAVQDFAKCIESGIKEAEVFEKRGKALTHLKRFEEAEKDFEMARSLKHQ